MSGLACNEMKKVKNAGIILLRIVLILTAVLFTALFLFDTFVQFRDNDRTLSSFFSSKKIPATIGYYQAEGRTLRHLAVGNPDAPVTILFLHGSPSSMSYFKKYFTNDTLLREAYMLAVDRPGYGYSGLGNPETSMEKQAKMIRPLLDSLHQMRHPLIIVGVSYGTSIACRIAMDYPDLVDGLVLVAPSLAPGEEKIYKIAYPIQFPFLKWAVPKMLISANAEKLSHKRELEKMLPHWQDIKIPVMYLQGKNDGLIYPSNAAFARRKLVNADCLTIDMIPGRGHLIMFSEIKRIKQSIIDMTVLAKNFSDGRNKRHPIH
jgi:pimeloyl-ACP methyl ester carboxylesterase